MNNTLRQDPGSIPRSVSFIFVPSYLVPPRKRSFGRASISPEVTIYLMISYTDCISLCLPSRDSHFRLCIPCCSRNGIESLFCFARLAD